MASVKSLKKTDKRKQQIVAALPKKKAAAKKKKAPIKKVVQEPVVVERVKRAYNRKAPAPVSNLFITTTINEETKRVKTILKANHLQHEVKGMGDYSFSKNGGTTKPVFTLGFKSPSIAAKVKEILTNKYHYDTTLQDAIVMVSLFKDDKVAKVTVESDKDFGGVVDEFKLKADAFSQNEQEIIEKLRDRAKRIVGLIKHKFDINPMRKGKTVGYSAGKIHQASTTGYNIRFSSEDMARKVCAFLESEHYDVSLNNLQLTVSLVKEPKQVEQEKHEQTSGLQKIENLVKATNDTLEKARTHGLSIEEIGARIFDYMHKNNIVIMEAGKKISIRDIVDGVKFSPVDKDEFVSVIVVDALK